MGRLSAQERRARLLAAAQEEFLKTGPAGARVRDIAARAGINEALIYRHFASKEELFEAAIVEPLDALVSNLLSQAKAIPSDEPQSIVDYTYAFYQAVLRIFADSIELFGVVLFSDREVGRAFYQHRISPFLDSVSETVETNLASWHHMPFEPARTTPIFVGMCWGVAMDAHFRGEPVDVDAAARLITDITFKGLGTP